jgi:hypothetical protein
MVSMVSTGLLLWIAWLCYRGYQHHCRENGQYSTSAVMSWMKERLFFWRQGTGAGTEHEQSKRKKRTFRRQHQQQWQREQGVQKHEDYWTEKRRSNEELPSPCHGWPQWRWRRGRERRRMDERRMGRWDGLKHEEYR